MDRETVERIAGGLERGDSAGLAGTMIRSLFQTSRFGVVSVIFHLCADPSYLHAHLMIYGRRERETDVSGSQYRNSTLDYRTHTDSLIHSRSNALTCSRAPSTFEKKYVPLPPSLNQPNLTYLISLCFVGIDNFRQEMVDDREEIRAG